MASETVHQWITQDMKLSRPVNSFETDFSNGYLFGEILSKYGFIDDMSLFSKKAGKESKVTNFQKVEQVLRDLKVKFDGKLIYQIMNEERGAALRLLYQVKLAIEKSDVGGVDAHKMTMTNLKPMIVNRKLEDTLNLKTTLPFNSKLTTINRASKLAPIEKSMLPYEYRKKLLEDKAALDQIKEEKLVMHLHMEARESERRKTEENREFMTDWLAEGKQNWKANQQRRTDGIARVQYFEDREVKIYKDKLSKQLDEATRELMGGVKEFEQNLQKLGIEKNTNIEEAMKRMEEKKGVPPGQIQNFSYAATMNKIKEKKNVQEFAAKERDRRRRKMVVDQNKTQSVLDQKKNEDLLIEKLLAQQQEEHKYAYLDRRNVKCKELVVETRRQKALGFEEKKRGQIEQIERKRNEGLADLVIQHKQELAGRKKDCQVLRREEKAEKRMVNREICSEVFDLIFDIANEAFDETRKSETGQIQKPIWREWMKWFKEGKVVSRARKGLLQRSNSQEGAVTESNNASTEEQVDILLDKQKSIEEVLDVMKYDQAYEDLLQYLSISGIFNVSSGDFEDQWTGIKSLVGGNSGITIDMHFLSSLIPPNNPTLGRVLQNLLCPTQTQSQEVTDQVVGIPSYLTLKLCLMGRAHAGKRTIAKQINELYPGGKVKILKMDEMIKDVLEYINPKPVVDAAALDKNKKAPPAKGGKVEDAQPVDPYAGIDTREYKEIGHQIKKFFGEGEIPQGQDLTSLIPDDQLLINLFIQKLKLSFPPEKSEHAKIDEIKQNLVKEKEILEQLAELEAANAGADPSKAGAKGGAKAPPPKKGGGAGPSGEEQLRTELEQVTKIQPEGWILVDFPRTLKQAKTMERLMNDGYTCMLDRPKDHEQKQYEMWSKLVNPMTSIAKGDDSTQFDGKPFIYSSATDGYLFLDVASEECSRRVSNRKVDPTTGTVYHLEDNPPPEGDPKLKDRLQDFAGEADCDQQRIKINHTHFDSQVSSLKKWAGTFGLTDKVIEQPVSLLMQVSGTKAKKEEVFEHVQKVLNQIIGFKQAQLEISKQKVREQIEREAHSQLQSHAEQPPVEHVQEDSNNVEEVKNEGIRNLDSQQSKGSIRVMSEGGAKKSVVQILSEEDKRALWSQFQEEYYRECLQVFRQIRKQRLQVFEGLTSMQSHFIETYLARLDTRQTELVQDFIDSYNKFSDEFPNLRNDSQTQVELNKRVTRLSNEMWELVEQKKDQALAQHSKLNSDGWVVNEMKKLMKSACRIIQQELQRYFVIESIVTGVNHSLEIDVQRTLENYSDDGILTIDAQEKSPLFDAIYSYTLRVLQERYSSVEALSERTLLKVELDSVVYKLNVMRTWVMLKVKEFNQFWSQLYQVLDNAIITAIKSENDATQSVVTLINEHILEQSTASSSTVSMDYSDFSIPYIDLEAEIERIDFSNADVPLYIQTIAVPDDPIQHMRLKITQLDHLYQDFRFHAYNEYLDGQTFTHLILLALQQNRVPTSWRYYDINLFHQMVQKFQVVPPGDQPLYADEQQVVEFMDWKKVFTMFTLLMSPLPDTEAIENYQQLLLEVAPHGEVPAEQFINIPAWFDEFEVMRDDQLQIVASTEEEEDETDRNKDQQRLKSIKNLLFKAHQSNTQVLKISEFISTLKELNALVNSGEYSNYNSFLFGE